MRLKEGLYSSRLRNWWIRRLLRQLARGEQVMINSKVKTTKELDRKVSFRNRSGFIVFPLLPRKLFGLRLGFIGAESGPECCEAAGEGRAGDD